MSPHRRPGKAGVQESRARLGIEKPGIPAFTLKITTCVSAWGGQFRRPGENRDQDFLDSGFRRMRIERAPKKVRQAAFS